MRPGPALPTSTQFDPAADCLKDRAVILVEGRPRIKSGVTGFVRLNQSASAPSASFSRTLPVRASTPTSNVLPLALMSNE